MNTSNIPIEEKTKLSENSDDSLLVKARHRWAEMNNQDIPRSPNKTSKGLSKSLERVPSKVKFTEIEQKQQGFKPVSSTPVPVEYIVNKGPVTLIL